MDEKDDLKPFYNRFPKFENFKAQIEEKQYSFSSETRQILVHSLKTQYASVDSSEVTENNINLLSDTNTFTITNLIANTNTNTNKNLIMTRSY